MLLLRSARVAIKTGRSTQLSSALEFLHRDFEESYYAWEIVEQAHLNLNPQTRPHNLNLNPDPNLTPDSHPLTPTPHLNPHPNP